MQFFAQDSAGGAVLRPQQHQIEQGKEKRGKGEPGAGQPEEDKPARMFPWREQRLQKRRAEKKHYHAHEKGNKHGPASRRLIADYAAGRMNGKGDDL